MSKFKTDRLRMDELTLADAPFIVTLLNDPSYVAHIGDRGIRTVEQAQHYLDDKIRASYRDHGFGLYAVRLATGGEPIGICGLVNRDSIPDVDIGYGFLPHARGQGYALEAAEEILKWAHSTLGLTRLAAIVSQENRPSIALLEKIGMQFDAMIQLPGDEEQICLYMWRSSEQ
ncbi:MAG: GNAT family N-acetyltransferase [Halioglobus sp.]